MKSKLNASLKISASFGDMPRYSTIPFHNFDFCYSGLRSSTIAENMETANEDNETDEESDYSVTHSISSKIFVLTTIVNSALPKNTERM